MSHPSPAGPAAPRPQTHLFLCLPLRSQELPVHREWPQDLVAALHCTPTCSPDDRRGKGSRKPGRCCAGVGGKVKKLTGQGKRRRHYGGRVGSFAFLVLHVSIRKENSLTPLWSWLQRLVIYKVYFQTGGI